MFLEKYINKIDLNLTYYFKDMDGLNLTDLTQLCMQSISEEKFDDAVIYLNKLKEIKNIKSTELINNMDIFSSLRDIIDSEKEKEDNVNIWNSSKFSNMKLLESNNVGNVGERFMQHICNIVGIEANINGSNTKELGGGCGDGIINNRTVEIKTARQGTSNDSFQHELGEKPWLADFMGFVDVSPSNIYITLMPNMSEDQYKKQGFKCPYFPTRTITWRKGCGAFKFTTTVNLNKKQSSVNQPHTIEINESTPIEEIRDFINRIVR